MTEAHTLEKDLVYLSEALKNANKKTATTIYRAVSRIEVEVQREKPTRGYVEMRVIPVLEEARKRLSGVEMPATNLGYRMNITEAVERIKGYAAKIQP